MWKAKRCINYDNTLAVSEGIWGNGEITPCIYAIIVNDCFVKHFSDSSEYCRWLNPLEYLEMFNEEKIIMNSCLIRHCENQ